MQDATDFSLRILVVEPERPLHVDEQLTTTPFVRANLPGVDLRPARERTATIKIPTPAAAAPAAILAVPSPEPLAASRSAARRTAANPLPPPRHAWLPSPNHPVPSRVRARSLLGVPPPPPTRASPLSDDDERRMVRRARAWRRMAWAQRMLERFQFAPLAH